LGRIKFQSLHIEDRGGGRGKNLTVVVKGLLRGMIGATSVKVGKAIGPYFTKTRTMRR